jgi:hypothetical protein
MNKFNLFIKISNNTFSSERFIDSFDNFSDCKKMQNLLWTIYKKMKELNEK